MKREEEEEKKSKRKRVRESHLPAETLMRYFNASNIDSSSAFTCCKSNVGHT